ncbi:hypothetical protein [Sabulicella rubraurantiaca]|uniref:hypothetical protein n=1 Tax=Sabulicella rubraurantiaca TaxID=2811429 RepID=UPI001A96706D|nr:hypothetical protein [Sabulicella rubraurantiaca]
MGGLPQHSRKEVLPDGVKPKRATPNASATAFTGNRPLHDSVTESSYVLACKDAADHD